jgi:hypothetical protein
MPEYKSGTNDLIITSTSASAKGHVQVGSVADQGLRIDEATGDVYAGKASPAAAATGGFLRIPIVATAPSGSPTSHAGYAPLVFCAADSKLYVHDGNAWVASSALA